MFVTGASRDALFAPISIPAAGTEAPGERACSNIPPSILARADEMIE
jgi:hypothetical protein